MTEVLEFIKKFNSPFTEELFTTCACYWFSVILNQRFHNSTIVYNPDQIHFATKIDGVVYDILGVVEDDSEYIDWSQYQITADDADTIIYNCIELR